MTLVFAAALVLSQAEPCVLQVSVAQRHTASELELDGVVTNVSKVPQTFRVQSRCPAPPFVLTGLPEAIDPFKTCMKGMCMVRDPIERTLAPGEKWVVGTAYFGRDDSQCGHPLRGGPYRVTASVTLEGSAPAVCSGKPVMVSGWPVATKVNPAPGPEPKKPRCEPIACKVPVCPVGQTSHDENGCPSCSCR